MKLPGGAGQNDILATGANGGGVICLMSIRFFAHIILYNEMGSVFGFFENFTDIEAHNSHEYELHAAEEADDEYSGCPAW